MNGGRARQDAVLHATTVAIDGQAVLIIGPSGAGKSTLALQLIGLGAVLISDDLTRVTSGENAPIAHAPDQMRGVIEARGLGLIHVPMQDRAPVKLVVDMAEVEQERLPPSRPVTFVVNQPVRTVWRVDAASFPSALFNMIKHGRYEHDHEQSD